VTAPEMEPLMTPAEVAETFRVSTEAVRRWVRAGRLTPVRTPGGRARYSAADIRALLNAAPEYPAPGSDIPAEKNFGMTGYVVGECGHRVAGSEWRAGFRTCERCPKAMSS